jgi:hypothetical protein
MVASLTLFAVLAALAGPASAAPRKRATSVTVPLDGYKYNQQFAFTIDMG